MSFSGFKEFLLKTNALALAIAVILGVALNAVVQSLVKDIIMPPVGLLLGGVDFESMKWQLNDKTSINYGTFINTVIAFIVIALVVYVISTLLIKPAPAAPTKVCPFCKESIPDDATKCRACTSPV